MSTGKVTVVGSANVDLVATTIRLPAPGETVLGSTFAEVAGGKGLNQAVAAARAGADVTFVAVVGADAAGGLVRSVLADDGIDPVALDTGHSPTGRALIGVDQHGENSIIVVPGANAELTPDRITIHGSVFAAAQVVLAQLEVPIEAIVAAFEAARAAGATTVLNPAPATDLPRHLLELTDLCIPNEHEVERLGGVHALHAAGVGIVVVTQGSRGATVSGPGGTSTVAPFPVVPVDTTGAGDSFCGALAARLALGSPLAEALRWAAASGALSTTRSGAVPSIPRLPELQALVDSQR